MAADTSMTGVQYVDGAAIRLSATIKRWVRWFLLSACGILLFAGCAKIASSFGHQKVLNLTDPVFGISFKKLMLSVGILEVIVSAICFSLRSRILSIGLIAWMATGFTFYRLGLHLSGWEKPCPCLGSFTDAIHLSPESADFLVRSLLIYLLVGSYGILLFRYTLQNRLKPST